MYPGNYFQAAISWIILSTIFLTLPGTAFPDEPWLGAIAFDKLIHLGIFSVMTILLCWAIYKRGTENRKLKIYFTVCFIAAVIYGVIIEFVQRDLIPFRSFDNIDIIADASGSFIGLLYSWGMYIKK